MEKKVTQMFNTRQNRDLNPGPCGWKAEILPLRQPHRRHVQDIIIIQSTPAHCSKSLLGRTEHKLVMKRDVI